MSNQTNSSKSTTYGTPSYSNSISLLCSTNRHGRYVQFSGKLRTGENEVSPTIFGCQCDYLSASGANDVNKELEKHMEAQAAAGS